MLRKQPHEMLLTCRDDQGELIGGIFGYVLWGWLHIDLLWVSNVTRGKGLGTRLMNDFMHLAREKGIRRFKLETAGFQAPLFYEKLGFKVIGEIEDLPPGYSNYIMTLDEIKREPNII